MDFVLILLVLLALVGYYLFATMQDMKIKKAEKAVQNGDLDTALSIFVNTLKKKPDDLEALWQLGNINQEKGHYPEAIGYYTKLIEIGKESRLFTTFELYRRVGLLYKKINRDQDALEFLFQAYNMIQSSKDVLENIAMIIYSQKYFHRAVPYFEKTILYLKNRPDFLKHYGLCLIMNGRINDALATLEDSVKQNEQDTEAKYILAYAYYEIRALQKARELIEDIVNAEKVSLSPEQFYYAIKMLFLIYLQEKKFDIARELIQQLKNLNNTINNSSFTEEINMAYIFFRIKQGYYDVAMEEIEKNINLKIDTDKLSDEAQKQLKENRSHLYELVSSLDKFKKEKEKVIYTGNKAQTYDVEYSMMENRAKDAQEELETIFDEWKEKFVDNEPLWFFFGLKPRSKFDPGLIIEKYTEDNIKVFKKQKENNAKKELDQTVVEADDPCETLLNSDIPTFLAVTRKLAENMGFKIINQGIKIDPLAFSEGKASDLLCQEKTKKDNRVLFCVRRWREPIGYLSFMTVLGALKTHQANRLVMISTSPLSLEANRAIEGNDNITFYLCEDVINYLS